LLLQKGSHDLDVLHWLCGGYSKRVTAMAKHFEIHFELRPEPTPIPDFQAKPDRCESCGGNGVCFAMPCDDCDGKGFVTEGRAEGLANRLFRCAAGFTLDIEIRK